MPRGAKVACHVVTWGSPYRYDDVGYVDYGMDNEGW